MPSDGCAIAIDHTDRGVVITVAGTLDRAAKDDLETAYRDATQAPTDVLLDLSDADYINSAGIAVLVGILALARADDREVAVCGLTDHYQELFRIARLTDLMTIHEDGAAARAAGWDLGGGDVP